MCSCAVLCFFFVVIESLIEVGVSGKCVFNGCVPCFTVSVIEFAQLI